MNLDDAGDHLDIIKQVFAQISPYNRILLFLFHRNKRWKQPIRQYSFQCGFVPYSLFPNALSSPTLIDQKTGSSTMSFGRLFYNIIDLILGGFSIYSAPFSFA